MSGGVSNPSPTALRSAHATSGDHSILENLPDFIHLPMRRGIPLALRGLATTLKNQRAPIPRP
jgi:hypothetical protein